MKRIAKAVEPNVANEVNKTAGLILATVVPATPVDTGRARGNWQVSTARSITSEINRLDQNGGSTISLGQSRINTRPRGATIYICNNVPYIQRLNDGYSAQAPAGFVQLAVRAAVAHVRNARILR